MPNNIALRAGQMRGAGLTNSTTAAILGAAPPAIPLPKVVTTADIHSLTTKLGDTSIIECKKKDYPFKCPEESEFATVIDRFRRTTLSLLPRDPISRSQFCAKFFFRGWCTVHCNLPHHQSIDISSVTALTEFGIQARAWAATNPMSPEDIAKAGIKRKWQRWDEDRTAAATPAPEQ